MNQLKEMDRVFWLIRSSSQLDKRSNLEAIGEVDLEDSGVISGIIPGKNESGNCSVAIRISHLEDF